MHQHTALCIDTYPHFKRLASALDGGEKARNKSSVPESIFDIVPANYATILILRVDHVTRKKQTQPKHNVSLCTTRIQQNKSIIIPIIYLSLLFLNNIILSITVHRSPRECGGSSQDTRWSTSGPTSSTPRKSLRAWARRRRG
jgi:hypothetical protein